MSELEAVDLRRLEATLLELKRLAGSLEEAGIPLLERISQLIVALVEEGLECFGSENGVS